MTTSNSLGESLPLEVERVRELLTIYESLMGMPQVNVAPMITILKAELRAAEQAMLTGDTVAMLRSYQSLRGYKE